MCLAVGLERHAVTVDLQHRASGLPSHGDLGQVAPAAHSFSGRECDILMPRDSSQPRVFSFAVRYVGALDTETKGTGRAVLHYKWGLGMCLMDKS